MPSAACVFCQPCGCFVLNLVHLSRIVHRFRIDFEIHLSYRVPHLVVILCILLGAVLGSMYLAGWLTRLRMIGGLSELCARFENPMVDVLRFDQHFSCQ